MTGTMTPIKMELTDNGDGPRDMSNDPSFSIILSVPNAFDLRQDVAAQSFGGTFDKALMAFSALKGELSGARLTESRFTPAALPAPVDITRDSGSFTSTGGADLAMMLAATGVTRIVTAPTGGMADTTEFDTTEFDTAVQTAFLPNGSVTVSLNPGAVSGEGYGLTCRGNRVAGLEGQKLAGTATLTLTGADKLEAALNAAPDDMKAQGLIGFGIVQGMAKTDGDTLVWQIDGATRGGFLGNGTQMQGGD